MQPLGNLLIGLNCHPEMAAALQRRVIEAYRANGLAYHNLDHIHDTIWLAEKWGHLVREVDAVLLALWFHDIVYDPRKTDNEEKSAAILIAWLAGCGVSESIIGQAAQLILATRDHLPQNPLEGLTVDADLAILGAPQARYGQYMAAIRQEYQWVGETDYRRGRKRVLNHFLERPHIYYHSPLAANLEPQARRNLTWELDFLAGKG